MRGCKQNSRGEHRSRSPALLKIRLFGTFEVARDGVPIPGLRQREGERLLAYLVLHSNQAVTYRTIAELFWPSEVQVQSEFGAGDFPSVRQAVRALRLGLENEAWRIRNEGKGVISFDPSEAEIDFLDFDRWVRSESLEDLRSAQDLHGAALLEGWNEIWVRDARERCRRSYDRITRMLDQARHSLALGIPSVPASSCKQSGALVEPQPSVASIEIESVGGAVPLGSRYYIERATDRAFNRAIEQGESVVLVKGARHIGKTSLLARGLHAARKAGARVVLTDFQALTASDLASPETLCRALASDLADQLDLETLPESIWSPRRSANRNLERYLHDVALESAEKPLVWGLDEVDRLFRCPYSSEVFGLFRSWHNLRAFEPDGLWNRLTLAMAYATEVRLFITDLNQSPFNVGTRLTLEDFASDQVEELNRKHGEPLQQSGERERFYGLLKGHPYLTRRGFAELAGKSANLATLESYADRNDGPFGDHLRQIMNALTQDPELTEVVRGLLRGTPCTEEAFFRLQSAGLLTGTSANEAAWRCDVYKSYLQRQLL